MSVNWNELGYGQMVVRCNKPQSPLHNESKKLNRPVFTCPDLHIKGRGRGGCPWIDHQATAAAVIEGLIEARDHALDSAVRARAELADLQAAKEASV